MMVLIDSCFGIPSFIHIPFYFCTLTLLSIFCYCKEHLISDFIAKSLCA